jgi:flavin reductase (DIM6/NTAB) family NADH-FMN oxidoreductase RutF
MATEGESVSASTAKGSRGQHKPRGAIRADMRQKKRDIARGELDAKLKGNLALEECVAHIECSVESREEAEGQALIYGMIER